MKTGGQTGKLIIPRNEVKSRITIITGKMITGLTEITIRKGNKLKDLSGSNAGNLRQNNNVSREQSKEMWNAGLITISASRVIMAVEEEVINL